MAHEHDPREHDSRVTVLGLGAMGAAMARTFLEAGHPTTVWNRTPHRADDLVAAGGWAAGTVDDAVTSSPLVIACLFDYDSVHEVLDPVTASLAGRVLVNVTTGSPAQARDMADWAREHGITYLDGGMLAVPDIVGRPGATFFYSGEPAAFEQHRPVLDVVADGRYVGDDAGAAALYDLALLAGMYAMFAGFFHGAAMVSAAGVSAKEFATMAGPWLTAMTASLPDMATSIDSGDYTTDVQSLEFTKSAVDLIVRAGDEHGIGAGVLEPVQRIIDAQIAAGHGDEVFSRIHEGIKHP